MPDMFVVGYAYQSSVNACVVDLVPPTFAGIATLVAQPNGSLLATWGAGTEVGSPPINYEVYVQLASQPVGDLFLSSNLALSTPGLSRKIFELNDGSVLVSGATYRVGVRARDRSGNLDQNLVALTAISTGVITETLGDLASQLYNATLAINQVVSAAVGGPEMEAEIVDTDVETDPPGEPDLETEC